MLFGCRGGSNTVEYGIENPFHQQCLPHKYAIVHRGHRLHGLIAGRAQRTETGFPGDLFSADFGSPLEIVGIIRDCTLLLLAAGASRSPN